MATANEIANYLIFLLQDTCDDLSNMKLNKLLYYAQGHCLKSTGHVLFDDQIEAWEHGPIVNSVYQTYKANGSEHITAYDLPMIDAITKEEQELLLDVARQYSRYTATALRNMAHVPGGPWDTCFEYGKRRTPIPVQLISDYFNKHVREIEPPIITYSDDDFIGYRDKDGCLVLPKEWDDEAV